MNTDPIDVNSLLDMVNQNNWAARQGQLKDMVSMLPSTGESTGVNAASKLMGAGPAVAPEAPILGGLLEGTPYGKYMSMLNDIGKGAADQLPKVGAVTKLGAGMGLGLASELLGHNSLSERVGMTGLGLLGPEAMAGGLAAC